VLVVVAGSFAIYASRVGLGWLPNLNISKPLLADVTPHLSPPQRPLSRRVVLVIIDGLSLRHSYNLPYLAELRSVGVDAAAHSHAPTISRPNYVTIVTGVPPKLSGVRNNSYGDRVNLDSVMDRLRAAAKQTAYVSESSGGFPYMFSQDIEDVTYAPWPNGFWHAAVLAIRREYPLVILLVGWVDDAGHLEGASSEEYRAAALRADRELRRALASIDLARDTVVVTADHGHTESGGHGGIEPDVLQVPLILAGAGVRPAALVRNARLVDVAPTVAALLGVSAPGHGIGRTLTEVLDLDESALAAIEAADVERATRNLEIAAADIEVARARADAKRVRRLSLVISAIALAIIMLVLGQRWGAFLVDWRVLLIAVPAFPLAFLGLLEMAGQQFSLSSLPDEGIGARRVFYFGLVSTVVHLIATWIALHGRVVLRDRLAAANALALCGLMVASVPAAMAWAFYGGGPFVELPGPQLLFLIPAMYIAVACYAIAATVTQALEFVVFFARAVDPRLPLRRAERKLERVKRRLSGQISEQVATAPQPPPLD